MLQLIDYMLLGLAVIALAATLVGCAKPCPGYKQTETGCRDISTGQFADDAHCNC